MITITSFQPLLNVCILIFQLFGIMVIVVGGAQAVRQLFNKWFSVRRLKGPIDEESFRMGLAKNIIFGLEFLIAGDVLSTLLTPQLEQLYSLGLLVVIRTILSMFVAREVKLHEHFPTRKSPKRA